MKRSATTGIVRNPSEGWEELARGLAEVSQGITRKDTALIVRGAARIVIGILG